MVDGAESIFSVMRSRLLGSPPALLEQIAHAFECDEGAVVARIIIFYGGRTAELHVRGPADYFIILLLGVL